MKFCPYAQRTRLVLNAKGIPHDVVNINLKDKPEWYFKIHPEGIKKNMYNYNIFQVAIYFMSFFYIQAVVRTMCISIYYNFCTCIMFDYVLCAKVVKFPCHRFVVINNITPRATLKNMFQFCAIWLIYWHMIKHNTNV